MLGQHLPQAPHLGLALVIDEVWKKRAEFDGVPSVRSKPSFAPDLADVELRTRGGEDQEMSGRAVALDFSRSSG